MSKRFTETDKWKDKWFRCLTAHEKLLWLYIIDNCDNAGFFELDIGMCSFFTGLDDDIVSGAIKGLARGLIASKCEGVYYVKNFLRHQKNDSLNPANNAHKQIIKIFEFKTGLFNDDFGAKQGLNSPIGKGIGKSNGNGTGNYDESDDYTDEFIMLWDAYPNKTGKLDAFRAFESIATPPITDLISAINKSKLSKGWSDDNGQYIPSLIKWISGRRWQDEIKTATNSVNLFDQINLKERK